MTKNQVQTDSIRQRQEMVKRLLAVAELLAKSKEATAKIDIAYRTCKNT